ncbi:hypothetical protein BP6252_04566 [Coleophoma cylindrospora]|uniref:Uncharacterized protein n=1 Tax=Coleophoma cylindrospora TaxID=1849047 RepID=A0A3D8S0Y1_9HELO|nr:hypothetical protein BP6252_04566 [Coleophoma cylindrospora]
MTIDTACSGSLVGLDVACRYLSTGEINGAIVGASQLFLTPEHVMDTGAIKQAHTLTGKCHTFDAKADGYIKAEAVNVLILKRLVDAVRDGDPIRAVIRGSATNSDGNTPGIASPSAEAQSSAIRAAYKNAGISNLNDTLYLEFHGTGTLAGDPIETNGVSNVFAPSRSLDNPLLIGSIKSNIGHSEPAAGVSGVLKAVLAIEHDFIPGNPTFVTPNPKIDMKALKLRAFRTKIPWPKAPIRRASVNSFGYGGSNAHVILDDAKSFLKTTVQSHVSSFISNFDDLYDDDEDESTQPFVLVFSANDESSLRAYCTALSNHLMNPGVNVKLQDLSYTLSERRSQHFHRAYVIAHNTELDESSFVFGKKNSEAVRIGFVFTGQGAQWPRMGREIVEHFPSAKPLLQRLDQALQTLKTPPTWSLLAELIEPRDAEHMRRPEFSQPLVTALQLVLLEIFNSWGVNAQCVIGHSSGEIAAACAAGLLTQEESIKIAYLRGQAAVDCLGDSAKSVGMMAVGLGPEKVEPYLAGSGVQIACYNSPDSVTLSGQIVELEAIKAQLTEDKYFARLLQVNLAYHSNFMAEIGKHYNSLLLDACETPLPGSEDISMFSSVTGQLLDRATDAQYWTDNMVSPVRFAQACKEMLSAKGKQGADFLIELGPSGALAGPVGQIKKLLASGGTNIQYSPALTRGTGSIKALFDTAGKLFLAGGSINLLKVNQDKSAPTQRPAVIVDLPNYVWNHSTKYWQETQSSRDWRYRQFFHHDLLGSKILGTSWEAPSWNNVLRLENVPWLQDHKMGSDILMPASGFISMAVEAIYQLSQSINPNEEITSANQLCYRLRNVKFDKALVLEHGAESFIKLTMSPHPGSKKLWYDFTVTSSKDDAEMEHCTGLIRLQEPLKASASKTDLAPLKYPTPANLWYRAVNEAGYGFGPQFQKQIAVESTPGQRASRSQVSLTQPLSAFSPQSEYPMHPACMDGCFQTVTPSLWAGDRTAINAVLVPAVVDDLVINAVQTNAELAVSVTTSEYTGRGRLDEAKSYLSSCSIYDSSNGNLLMQLTGLRYHKLDAGKDANAHQTYNHSIWKPDISLATQDQLASITPSVSSSKIQQTIDLIAHKKPNLKILEVQLSTTENPDMTSYWFEGGDKPSRAAYHDYLFVATNPKVLLGVQEAYAAERNTEFSLLDMTKAESTLARTDFDLVLIRFPEITEGVLKVVAENTRKLLSPEGFALFVEQRISDMQSDSDDSSTVVVTAPNHSQSLGETQFSSALGLSGFGDVRVISCETVTSAFLSGLAPEQTEKSTSSSIEVFHLTEETDVVSETKKDLAQYGWTISNHKQSCAELQPKSTALVLDEISHPVFASVSKQQWDLIKELITRGCKILWVTKGSQFKVTEPDYALVHGLFRTVRAEDPSLSLTTLDVGSKDSPAEIALAINRMLNTLSRPTPKEHVDYEYAIRDGTFHVSRVLPDGPVNTFKTEEVHGAAPVPKALHDIETVARMRAERVGTLDLQFVELSTKVVPVEEGKVEVEIHAIGLNFKDVAVTMGIVPENEEVLGCEGAGIVRRVGKGVDGFKPGDRVAVGANGCFANRNVIWKEQVHLLPDWLSFEDAATIPLVYSTSMYALFDTAGLKKGQSVLIHSAAGGVGIAAIQLAQYVGAEIYVTVGADEKRKYLAETFGIPPERMFSSRNTDFGAQIMKVTQGKGIDVILNSLTGELLDESWRICADAGILVEIGKRDMVDRNYLSMEPFDRNCSYRAVDWSHKSISLPLVASVLSRVFDLVEKKHITPIRPITTFAYDSIPASFSLIRSGKHMGKIIITEGKDANPVLPVRPAVRKLALRSEVSYLIVGGLKGLCGSLAVHMAQQGAKHLVIMSRSGCSDEKSQGIIAQCTALGCDVQEAKADVSNEEDVRRVFKDATPPIAGIVQGAMVLRDTPYEIMTVEDFHAVITSKVQGTWNLHHVCSEMEKTQPLDFFTLLSSISGIEGKAGQANYAAANVFLDAFAIYRQSLGLAANSLNLGVIEDVGYVAEQTEAWIETHFDRRHWTYINEAVLRKMLSYSILQQTDPISKSSSGQLITGIAVPQPPDSNLIQDARFAAMFISNEAAEASSKSNNDSKHLQEFFLLYRSSGEPGAVLNSAVEVLNKQLQKMLGLEEPLEPAKSLSAYGLDSLSAVELRNWVRAEIGAELTMLEVVNSASLFALGEKIITKLGPVAAKD